MSTNNNHGGARKGAGRKSKGTTKQIRAYTTSIAELKKRHPGKSLAESLKEILENG